MGMREKLIELMDEYLYPSSVEGMADHLIANGVTIPVRCKDCKHCGLEQEPCHGRTQRFCKLHKVLVVVGRDTFCSYGERRTDA